MKKKIAPKIIKSMPLGDMINEAREKQMKAAQYVKDTGLCCAGKENPVTEGRLRCQSCLDKTEALLRQLQGRGFMELRV